MASSRVRVGRLVVSLALPLVIACSDRLADGVSGSGVADDSGTFATLDEVGEDLDGESGSGTSATTDAGTTLDESSSDTLDGQDGVDTSTSASDTSASDTSASDTSASASDTSASDTSASATDTSSDTASDTSSGTATDTGTSDTGVEGCVGACGTPGCGDCPDGEFIDLGDFAIGATEVTIGQYGQFLTVDFDLAGLPDTCTWKAAFTPDSWASQMQKNPALPVTSVDWCDAWAYCTWSGGHVCGQVGGDPAALADFDDPINNEWFAACTDGGSSTWPYGNVYDGAACNGVDAGIGATAPVGSLAGCEGGQPGVFDLSGNVWEWESACADSPMTDDASEDCRYRGGSYFSGSNVLRCSIDAKRPRAYRNANTGIRCCATP
ncbi:formylglycine-generating enzyme family protein [Nannocystaceae bacterium ST9]